MSGKMNDWISKRSVAVAIGVGAGLVVSYLMFGPSEPPKRAVSRLKTEWPQRGDQFQVGQRGSVKEKAPTPSRQRPIGRRLIDFLLTPEDPRAMGSPPTVSERVDRTPVDSEFEPAPSDQQIPLDWPAQPIQEVPPPTSQVREEQRRQRQVVPRSRTEGVVSEPERRSAPRPRPKPVYREEILLPEFSQQVDRRSPSSASQVGGPLPQQERVEQVPIDLVVPPREDSRFSRLLVQQKKFLAMGWRKFISRRNHFTIWTPGQLYFHLYADEERTELYHCEYRRVIYGVQRQELPLSERPVGRGNQLAFFKAAVQLWIDQYMEEAPQVRVLHQTLHETPPFISQDIMVLGPHGQTKLRIGYQGSGLYWIWTAYRNDRIGEERFADFLSSLDVLR